MCKHVWITFSRCSWSSCTFSPKQFFYTSLVTNQRLGRSLASVMVVGSTLGWTAKWSIYVWCFLPGSIEEGRQRGWVDSSSHTRIILICWFFHNAPMKNHHSYMIFITSSIHRNFALRILASWDNPLHPPCDSDAGASHHLVGFSRDVPKINDWSMTLKKIYIHKYP